MEIGLDNELIERFEKMDKLDSFLKKYFTENEIKYIYTKVKKFETIAGIYCGKEAFLKATKLGIGTKEIMLKDVEILHEENGAPYIFVNEKIEKLLQKLGAKQIKISTTHTKIQATSVCLIY